MIFAILPRNSFCSLHGTWTLLACCCSGLPFLGAKWIQAALLPFDASLSNLFAKDALHAQLNAYFVLHYCMAMWHTRLPFWAVFDVALKNMFPSTQLGSVGPWYQDSSLTSDGLLSQELASGGRERKSRSLLHHATGRTWVNTQGLAWVDMVDWYFSAAGDLPKSWENLRFTRSMVFVFIDVRP